jgi:predicted permease
LWAARWSANQFARAGEKIALPFDPRARIHGQFATHGLVDGRDFRPGEAKEDPTVAIVNRRFAEHFFSRGRAIGKRIGFGDGPEAKLTIEIVGVVKDGRETDLRKEVARTFYVPFTQQPDLGQMTFFGRTRADGAVTGEGLRRMVRELDASIPVFDIKSMEAVTDESLFVDRMVALLSASFGALATLLAAIGLYGVMSYAVARRTREIGLRMALGADAGRVVWMVMREVVVMALVGVAVGLPLAVASGRLVSSLLFGVSAADPLTLANATGFLLSVALFAGYVPAGQATRVDPMRALRRE